MKMDNSEAEKKEERNGEQRNGTDPQHEMNNQWVDFKQNQFEPLCTLIVWDESQNAFLSKINFIYELEKQKRLKIDAIIKNNNSSIDILLQNGYRVVFWCVENVSQLNNLPILYSRSHLLVIISPDLKAAVRAFEIGAVYFIQSNNDLADNIEQAIQRVCHYSQNNFFPIDYLFNNKNTSHDMRKKLIKNYALSKKEALICILFYSGYSRPPLCQCGLRHFFLENSVEVRQGELT